MAHPPREPFVPPPRALLLLPDQGAIGAKGVGKEGKKAVCPDPETTGRSQAKELGGPEGAGSTAK